MHLRIARIHRVVTQLLLRRRFAKPLYTVLHHFAVVHKMQVLSFSFNMLSFCGVWLPVRWEGEKRRRYLYQLFSISSICANHTMVLLGIILLLTMGKFDVKFLTGVLFTLFPAITYCAKAVNFIVRRKKIVKLADMLVHRYCLPSDPVEMRLEQDMNNYIRLFTIVFNGFAQTSLFCLLMAPVLQESHQRELPFRVWLPFDLRVGRNFWLAWACEVCLLILGILINITTDIIVSGFVLHACIQLDFLCHRLRRLPEVARNPQSLSKQSVRRFEAGIVKQAILHHRHIIEFTKRVTETFDLIIIEQFITSALVLSIAVYELTLGNIPKLQKVMTVGYLICMLVELFCYCWFGNEISLKSIELGDYIYTLDWTLLNKQSKKTLMFIMLRTSRPVVMCYGSLITLNIESYKSILKVTYSVLNVLKESSSN